MLREARAVLHDFTLRIGFPEHIAIVGPNGAGKSTFLRLVSRESYPVPNERTVCRILGRERWNVFELRSQLGIVAGDIASRFAPAATVADVAASTLERPDTDAVRDVLDRLGIRSLAKRNIHELSSGEWQRTALARALVHRPRALILDEPANSLDVVAQRELRSALRSLAAEGVGIVLVTHQLEDVIPEIQRIAFVREGRVIADGAKSDLFTAEPLRQLFGAAVEVECRDGVFSMR